MEKLIELVYEYEKTEQTLFPLYYDKEFGWCFDVGGTSDICTEGAVSYLISKKFGFIKWLIENDKIDLGEKLFNLTKNDNRKSTICDLDNNDFSWEDTFLMLLSISDTPIEDLLLYLK